MGLAAPSIGMTGGTDRPHLREAIRKVTEDFGTYADAKAAGELVRSMTGQDSSALSKAFEGLGEAFGSLAKGMEAAGNLQQGLLKQVADRLTATGGSGSIGDLLGLLIVMDYLDQRQARQEERARQRAGDAGEESPWMKRWAELVEAQLAEAKQRSGPSPADQQLHELTMSLLSNHLATVSDPMAQVKALAEMRKTLEDAFGGGQARSEYSEGALRMRALEKEEKGLEKEHDRYMAGLAAHERALAYHYPRLGMQLIQGLGQLAASFGLIPTQRLQFGQEAEYDADAALAAAKGAAGGA